MTTQELAALKALVAAEEARQNVPQLSDSSIADAAALGEEPPMCEIFGPYKDRKSWRVRIVDTLTNKRMHRFFQTEEDAKAAIPRLMAEYRRPVGVPMTEALAAYAEKQ